MADLNIIHGTIVRPEGCLKGSIEICEGKISRIVPEGESVDESAKTIDAEGMLIFPGMIDSHVHIRGGKLSHREDFKSGTMAAASGGVTTIVEMPVTNPPASRSEDFVARIQEVKEQAYVDFALYGGAGDDNLDQIPILAKDGAIAYKTFLMPPVPGREPEFFGLCSDTEEKLMQVMGEVAKTGLMLAIHSELNELVQAATDQMKAEGGNDLASFCHSRPIESETEAVKRVIRCARKTGCKTSICHVSTPEALQLIKEAQADGVNIHAETCPHYLLYNEENAAFAGVFARMKPPLRDPERMNRLCQMYAEGNFEMTGSDHAPYLKDEKLHDGKQDIWNTFDGLPGLELSLPLLLNAVADGKLTYEAIARNTAESTARLLGIQGKGRIEEGNDADLVLVQKCEEPWKLDITKLYTKSRESAVLYDGTPMNYRIQSTFVRGNKVFENGEITGKQGWGEFVSPVK